MAAEKLVRSNGLEPLLGAIFDLVDTDSSGNLTLEEIVNVQLIFHAPVGATIEERFAALIGLFDQDGDGCIGKDEVKTLFGKALCVIRRIIYLFLDLALDVVFDGALELQARKMWSELFPTGLTPEVLRDLAADPEVELTEKADRFRRSKFEEANLAEVLSKMRDRPLSEHTWPPVEAGATDEARVYTPSESAVGSGTLPWIREESL